MCKKYPLMFVFRHTTILHTTANLSLRKGYVLLILALASTNRADNTIIFDPLLPLALKNRFPGSGFVDGGCS